MKKKIIQRKNLRLLEYNYSNIGCYFITICVQNRKNILSKIVKTNNDVKLILFKYGKIVKKYLEEINEFYKDINIINYVIMPKHIHFICEIINNNNSNTNEIIPFIVSTLKRFTNKACKEKIWQRNYYDHIIRNEKEYLKVLEYIENNPYKWHDDIYYN